MLKWLLTPCSDLGILVLRVGFGLSLFLGHGLGKVQNFQHLLHTFMNPIGIGPEVSFVLAVFAEALCALLIVIGLFTRPAAVVVIILFVVIHFVVMKEMPVDPNAASSFFMGKEMVRLFLIGFAAILLAGPGKYSLDHLLFRKKV
jgi:putative oxidoreductase